MEESVGGLWQEEEEQDEAEEEDQEELVAEREGWMVQGRKRVAIEERTDNQGKGNNTAYLYNKKELKMAKKAKKPVKATKKNKKTAKKKKK